MGGTPGAKELDGQFIWFVSSYQIIDYHIIINMIWFICDSHSQCQALYVIKCSWPDPDSHPSDPGSHPPDPGSHAPDPGSHAPDPGSHPPDPGSHPPDPGSHPPDPGSHPPDPGSHPPDPGSHPPDPGSASIRIHKYISTHIISQWKVISQ